MSAVQQFNNSTAVGTVHQFSSLPHFRSLGIKQTVDHKYIAHQIDFIQKATAREDSQGLIDNAKWRIASHTGIPDLDITGQITEEQKNQVNQLILKFADSQSGKQALAEIKVEVNYEYFRNSK